MRDGVTVEDVADFIIWQFGESALATVRGRITELSQFLAYLQSGHPAVIKARTCAEIQSHPAQREVSWSVSDLQPQPSEVFIESVDAFRQGLSEQQYGTRLHAFVELMIAAQARAKPIRATSMDNLDLEEKTVSLQVHEKSTAVSPTWSRTVELPDKTAELLSDYIAHDREPQPNTKPEPLFTTTNGRVGASILRRSIKNTSHTIIIAPYLNGDDGPLEVSTEDEIIRTLTLDDIYRYSLNKIMESY